MNHVYRSLWSDVTRTFVAVAEGTRSRGKRSASSRAGGMVDAVGAASAARVRPMALEPRLMFDAAAVVAAADAVHATQVAEAGVAVFSNAKNYRMLPDVPLVVPEVNPDHIQAITRQRQVFVGCAFGGHGAGC